MTIRPASVSDGSAVVELWSSLMAEQHEIDPTFCVSADAAERWLNDFREWVEAPDVRRIVVAESDGDLVGFASCQLWWPPPVYKQVLEVYLDELYVIPTYRRQGIGSQLLTDVADWARDKEAARIRLGTLAANKDAVEFWKKKGATDFLVAMILETGIH